MFNFFSLTIFVYFLVLSSVNYLLFLSSVEPLWLFWPYLGQSIRDWGELVEVLYAYGVCMSVVPGIHL